MIDILYQGMVNAFSFCLYGAENPLYYVGLFENLELIRTFFPTWVTYVWLGADVSEVTRNRILAYPNVRIRDTNIVGSTNMIHRFYAIDEPDVDIMLVRDADSRIHWKDRWAIREFIRQPQFVAHTIRDHSSHIALIMGGLWGLRKSAGLNMRDEYARYNNGEDRPIRLGYDQDFLGDVLYEKLVPRMLVHYSNNRQFLNELATPFPFAWSPDLFCGQPVSPGYGDPPQPIVSRVLALPEAVVRVGTTFSSNTPAPAPAPVPQPTFVLSHLRDSPPNLLTFLNRK
jgi:hypothetical protein